MGDSSPANILPKALVDPLKVESADLNLAQTEFSLPDCIESTLDSVGARVAGKKIDLLYEVAENVPTMVRGDPARLRQIVVNLVGNAVKFTDQGEVVLSLRADDDEWGEGNGYLPQVKVRLHFAVRDTGIGIPPERQAQLFKSISPTDASATRKSGDPAPGLVTSQRLAEMMGGSMWVESPSAPLRIGETGKGSTFHFTVCVDRLPDKPRGDAAYAPGVLAGRRMLIVDDNATSRRILAAFAAGWEMMARAAKSGPEALTILRTGATFDVAVLDLQMPEMDGVTLAEEIRRVPTAAKLPLVLLSSPGEREVIPQPDLFVAELLKPAKPSQLREIIARLV